MRATKPLDTCPIISCTPITGERTVIRYQKDHQQLDVWVPGTLHLSTQMKIQVRHFRQRVLLVLVVYEDNEYDILYDNRSSITFRAFRKSDNDEMVKVWESTLPHGKTRLDAELPLSFTQTHREGSHADWFFEFLNQEKNKWFGYRGDPRDVFTI